MPFRHGVHHGLSFVLSIFVSVLLTELFRPLLPGVLAIFDDASKFVIKLTKIGIDYKVVSVLIIAIIVAIIYGIVYGWRESRRG